ncbi:MAG: hypothetical protein ACI9R3_003154 [Verrucomicrobiales bacterium]|jgi:hypothetical protein
MKTVRITAIARLLAMTPIVALLVSCGSTQTVGHSGFLPDPERLSRANDLPFDKDWRAPGIDLRKYSSVEVAEVSADFLHLTDENMSSKKMAVRRSQVGDLAQFTRSTFEGAFANQNLMGHDGAEGQGRLICELAIVEFTPSKPLGNVVGYSFGVAGQVVSKVLLGLTGTAIRGSGVRGHITIEGQFRDEATDNVVFMFADKQSGRPSLASIKNFQRSAHAKSQIKILARQCARALTKTPEKKIHRSLPVDLKPW